MCVFWQVKIIGPWAWAGVENVASRVYLCLNRAEEVNSKRHRGNITWSASFLFYCFVFKQMTACALCVPQLGKRNSREVNATDSQISKDWTLCDSSIRWKKNSPDRVSCVWCHWCAGNQHASWKAEWCDALQSVTHAQYHKMLGKAPASLRCRRSG